MNGSAAPDQRHTGFTARHQNCLSSQGIAKCRCRNSDFVVGASRTMHRVRELLPVWG